MNQDRTVDVPEEISVLSLGAVLLRKRWRIVRWSLIGGIIALLIVWTRPAVFPASASFIPQGADPGRSGLASLAGQFGVPLSSGSSSSPSLTPDFYVRLLTSRGILGSVVRDTLTVPELGGKRVILEDLLEASSGSAQVRQEAAVAQLSRQIVADNSKTTGIVEFYVRTQWPSVSLAIVRELLHGVNDFNQQTRRDQAASERQFIEGRLGIAQAQLRAAEDRLQQFLQSNRQVRSPELQFAQDRMEREVTLRQQLVTSLTQSYEEVRMREVRDIPVITMVDEPMVPAKAESRGRAIRILAGLLIGAAAGAVFVFVGDLVARRRAMGDPAAEEFAVSLTEVRESLRRRMRGFGNRQA